MKRKIEKNVHVYNEDVKKLGRYEYTGQERYSAVTAGKKQSEEIIRAVREYADGPKKILDVGSGDGTYTFELFKAFKPEKIVGFDFSKEGVELAKAKIKKRDIKKIRFVNSSIYDVNKKIKEKFDVTVVRGVLHHLYEPQKGIRVISNLTNIIVVVEPNGYSPLMKVIEKVSPYHRKHEEKSYWPPTLNSWFVDNGFRVSKQKFFGPVPFFFPETFARMIKRIEPLIENIPYLNRIYCASNLIVYEK